MILVGEHLVLAGVRQDEAQEGEVAVGAEEGRQLRDLDLLLARDVEGVQLGQRVGPLQQRRHLELVRWVGRVRGVSLPVVADVEVEQLPQLAQDAHLMIRKQIITHIKTQYILLHIINIIITLTRTLTTESLVEAGSLQPYRDRDFSREAHFRRGLISFT